MTATRTDGALLLNNPILPCYRNPGDPMSPGLYAARRTGKRGSPGSSASKFLHQRRFELRAHRASQHLEQHHDAVLVAQFDQTADHVLEGAGADPHQLAEPQRAALGEAIEYPCVLLLAQRLDDMRGDGHRLAAAAHQIAYPDGRQNRPPAGDGAVDPGKQVARKKWPQHGLAP